MVYSFPYVSEIWRRQASRKAFPLSDPAFCAPPSNTTDATQDQPHVFAPDATQGSVLGTSLIERVGLGSVWGKLSGSLNKSAEAVSSTVSGLESSTTPNSSRTRSDTVLSGVNGASSTASPVLAETNATSSLQPSASSGVAAPCPTAMETGASLESTNFLQSIKNGTAQHDGSATLLPSELENRLTPVQFEQYGREFMQMTGQDTFDGFRLEAGKTVTRQLQANHSLMLGTSATQEGFLYQFGPTFGLDDGSLFLMSRYANDGTVTTRGIKKIGAQTEARVSASSCLAKQHRNAFEVILDHSGRDWASCVKAAWQGTWILNSAFSQVVAPDFHLGGDMTWVAANGATIGSIGTRYKYGNHIFSGLLSRQPNFKSRSPLLSNSHSGKLQYVHKVSDRLSLGAELEIVRETPNTESMLRFGYEYAFRQARVQGLLDTAGKISMMAQDASGFGVSGTIDYWKGDYRFGFMMQLIPPPDPTSGAPGAPDTASNLQQ